MACKFNKNHLKLIINTLKCKPFIDVCRIIGQELQIHHILNFTQSTNLGAYEQGKILIIQTVKESP